MGVDRNRRAADTSAVNMPFYVLEITVNDSFSSPRTCRDTTRKPEKPGSRTRREAIFFRNCAKHRLFSMLFSAPS
jgi:hypothetical protein